MKLQIWDTAGQERYQLIAKSYYRRAVGAILVYDISRRKSFDHISKWLKVVEENTEPDCCVILIGNKIDLDETEREVSYKDGESFAKINKIEFMETSAKVKENIDVVFLSIAQNIYDLKLKKTKINRTDSYPQHLPFMLQNDVKEETRKRRCCPL